MKNQPSEIKECFRSGTMKVAAAVLLLAVAIDSAAQIESSLSYRRYTTQDGLPQMQAEKLFQDSRGYIYIGTLSGLVRFDGRVFTPFLKGKRYNIVGFAEAADRVWAMSFRQRWAVGQEQLRQYRLCPDAAWLLNNFNSGDLPEGMIVMEDEQETHRWIGRLVKADKEHSNLSDGLMAVERVLATALLDSMTPDRKLYWDKGTVYIPTPQGLFRATAGKEAKPQRIAENATIYSLRRWGDTLYAFAEDGIYTVSDSGVRLLTAVEGWQAGYGLTVREAGRELLIADEHSIYTFDKHTVSKTHGGINLIKDMLTDRWGRLWVATYEGVYCFFGCHFTNHRLTDEDDIVRAVAYDGEGHRITGSLNGKIMVDGQISYEQADNFFLPSAATIGGRVYMAAKDDVAEVFGDSVRWLGLPYERYQFVAEADGRLVIGTRRMTVAYDPATATVDTLTTEIAHPWCAAYDGGEHLWVGSTFGLFSIDTKTHKTDKADYQQQKLIITTMEADRRGTVFFASGDSLFLIRHGEIGELSSQMPQLEGHEIRALHISPKGYLVVAVIDGLFVCHIDDDYRLSDICFFDHRNGFTMIEPLKATLAEDSTGMVTLCSLEAMCSFVPADLVAAGQADTFVRPPLCWYEHWWVWLLTGIALLMLVWWVTRWYEKLRSRRKMLRLQREKMEREQLINAIRSEALKAERSQLAKDIVKMTDKPKATSLALKTPNGTLVVEASDIVFLKADGNYTQMVTFYSTEMVLTGLGALAKQLDNRTFVRADRSTLVNIGYICRLNAAQRTCTFRSPDGKEIETTLLAPAFKRLSAII